MQPYEMEGGLLFLDYPLSLFLLANYKVQERVCYKGSHGLEVSKLRAFGYVAMRSDSFEFGVVGVRWDENVGNR